ncbi:hypothetical protein CHS0354_010946 [Potamilus streckersoni]|uniref:Uncharacterized protein n=1 Tax=Potamilus streckersoni TaxID=2493646 RepID=A0AAE0SSP3_9BIVA|nr:hypothetical protein CHS0354_010946 [Potamilus streckersoni]
MQTSYSIKNEKSLRFEANPKNRMPSRTSDISNMCVAHEQKLVARITVALMAALSQKRNVLKNQSPLCLFWSYFLTVCDHFIQNFRPTQGENVTRRACRLGIVVCQTPLG